MNDWTCRRSTVYSFIDFSELPHYGWDRQLGHCEQGHRARRTQQAAARLRRGQRRKTATYINDYQSLLISRIRIRTDKKFFSSQKPTSLALGPTQPAQLNIQCNIGIVISFYALRPHQTAPRTPKDEYRKRRQQKACLWCTSSPVSFRRVRKFAKKRLLISSRLSVCPHWNSAPTG